MSVLQVSTFACINVRKDLAKQLSSSQLHLSNMLNGVDFAIPRRMGFIYLASEDNFKISEFEIRLSSLIQYPIAVVALSRSFSSEIFAEIQLAAAIQGATILICESSAACANYIIKLALRPPTKTGLSQECSLNLDDAMVTSISNIPSISRTSAAQVLNVGGSLRNLTHQNNDEKFVNKGLKSKKAKITTFLNSTIPIVEEN